MVPLFNLQADGAISGVKLTGGGGFGHYGQSCGPCAIRASGQARTLVENVDLTQFRGGGVWFGDAAAGITRWDDDAQRNILRHVRISHIQQYGFGYGCGLQGSRQSFLIEASILEDCRHLTMSSGGTTTAYELRYCILGNAVYANSDQGPATIQSHQVDVHGGGWDNQSYRCGAHLWVHHCEFSANNAFSEKPNVCIRGRMVDEGEAVIENCWTRKRHGKDPAGAYTDLETVGNGRIVMLAEAEGQPWKGPAALSSAGVIARNNWYGPEAPPADDAPADTGTVPQIYSADIRVAQLEAPLAILGQPYAVTATVTNQGRGAGSATIEIGWIPAGGQKVPLHVETVALQPGQSATVVQAAQASALGDWTFYCGDLQTVLKVREVAEPEPAPAAHIEISGIYLTADEGCLRITATLHNSGDAEGTIELSGRQCTLAPGASERSSINIFLEFKYEGEYVQARSIL